MLSVDIQFMLDEEQLQFLTWLPTGLTSWQIWLNALFPSLVCLVHTSYSFMNEEYSNSD